MDILLAADTALCSMPSCPDKETIKRSVKEVAEKFAEADCSILNLENIFGNREYVSRYRGENSYKWNPEDERLQFAWITVHLGKEAVISGEIYKWI